MTGLFDSHAHLQNNKFREDRDEAIERAREAGVTRILNLATRSSDAQEVIDLAREVDECIAAVGVHPTDLDDWSPETERTMMRLAEAPEVVVYGEIGLDYYWDRFERGMQRDIFRRQLAMARELRLSVAIHSRDKDGRDECYNDILADLKAEDGAMIGGVAHCFVGSLEQAKEFVGMGFALGVGGVSTFKKSNELRETLRAIGPEHLIVETDSPYLAPEPKRGKRNEPSFVRHTAERLAETLEMDFEELKGVLWENTLRTFRME